MRKFLLFLCVSVMFASSLFSQSSNSLVELDTLTKDFKPFEYNKPIWFTGNFGFLYQDRLVPIYSMGLYDDTWNNGLGTNFLTMWMSGQGGIKFFTTSKPRMVINKDGYVGVNTTTPAQMFHVVGGNILISRTSEKAKADGSANGSILFGADVTLPDSRYGEWGIEYLDEENSGPGLNFWKVKGFNYAFFLHNNGNVGIGTNRPQYKLDVIGTIRAQELIIDMNGVSGADFVFAPKYNLAPLNEVEQFIRINRHLPDIPSEAEMQQNGLSVQEFQIQLLRKVEELTLYVINQEKSIRNLEEENSLLKEQLQELKY